MKQPTIEIKDQYKSFGIKKITKLVWAQEGILSMIGVKFMSDSIEDLKMFDYSGNGKFENVHGNLFGTIIFNS